MLIKLINYKKLCFLSVWPLTQEEGLESSILKLYQLRFVIAGTCSRVSVPLDEKKNLVLFKRLFLGRENKSLFSSFVL